MFINHFKLGFLFCLAILFVTCPYPLWAQPQSSCSANINAWVSKASKQINVPIKAVSCPSKIVKLRLHPQDAPPIELEIAEPPGPAFIKAGRFRVSPILEVDDYSTIPQPQQDAVRDLVAWLTEHEADITLNPESGELPRKPLRWIWWFGLALLLIILTVSEVLRNRKKRKNDPDFRRLRWPVPLIVRHALLLLILFALIALIGWACLPKEMPFAFDSTYDVLLALELYEGGGGQSAGPGSSLHINHGTAHHWFLGFLLNSGATIFSIPIILLVLFSCSLMPLSLVFRKMTNTIAALAATFFLALSMFLYDGFFQPIWNPTFVPVVITAAATAGIWCCSTHRNQVLALVITSALYALCTQVHIQNFFLFPGFIVLALFRPNRIAKLLLIPTVILCVWDVFSHDGLFNNLGFLINGEQSQVLLSDWNSRFTWRWIPSIGSVLCVVFALFFSVVFFLRKHSNKRAFRLALFLAVCLISHGVACGIAQNFVRYSHRYWIPLYPFATAAFLMLIWHVVTSWKLRSSKLISLFIVAMFVAFAVWQNASRQLEPPLESYISFNDINKIRQTLEEEGYSIEATYVRLASDQTWLTDFSAGLWVFAPCLRDRSKIGMISDNHQDVMALRVPKGSMAQLDLDGHNATIAESHSYDYLLVRQKSFIKRHTFSSCSSPDQNRDQCRIFTQQFKNWSFKKTCFSRYWAGMASNIFHDEQFEPYFVYHVRIPARADPRILRLGSTTESLEAKNRCRGIVVTTQNIKAKIADDRKSVTFFGTESDQTGTITITWHWHEKLCFGTSTEYPLPMSELDVDLDRTLKKALSKGTQ